MCVLDVININKLQFISSENNFIFFPGSISEFMMTGLRLVQEGVSEDIFQARFGRSMLEVYKNEIDELCRLGLLENFIGVGGHASIWRITERGRLLGNQVFMRFVDS